MKKFTNKTLLAAILVTSSCTAVADNTWQKETLDAWIDGKAETTLLLNANLNSFDINTDVNNQIVTLTGSVEDKTEKSLAQELILSLDDVNSINNQLTIVPKGETKTSEAVQTLTDTSITTIVTTRLLMNTDVSGTHIDVQTKDNVVILKGSVSSNHEHELALSIANSSPNVEKVVDKLEVI